MSCLQVQLDFMVNKVQNNKQNLPSLKKTKNASALNGGRKKQKDRMTEPNSLSQTKTEGSSTEAVHIVASPRTTGSWTKRTIYKYTIQTQPGDHFTATVVCGSEPGSSRIYLFMSSCVTRGGRNSPHQHFINIECLLRWLRLLR